MTQNGNSMSIKNFEYVSPQYGLDGFNCPHCNAFSQQDWYYSSLNYGTHKFEGRAIRQRQYTFAVCFKCGGYSIWRAKEKSLIYPLSSPAPLPHNDMPEKIKTIYCEAREIVNSSPRGAAALLRLATEELSQNLVNKILEKNNKDLNNNIAILVKDGLPITLQKAMDTLRIIGNNAVHPGLLDAEDDMDIALKLFKLLNVIVENRITQPSEIDSLYDNKVPESKKEAIEKRNSK